MELNEKLQTLRKQRGLTQEELAQALYVSRTAVSKWESARGTPSIDSLMALASFFGITIDELLTSHEALTIADAEKKQTKARLCDLVFGLLDVSCLLFVFLPFFGQRSGTQITAVSLLALEGIASYLKVAYTAVVTGLILSGILTLALQMVEGKEWRIAKRVVSLGLTIAGLLLFIISSQPYGAAYLLMILVIKGFMLVHKG